MDDGWLPTPARPDDPGPSVECPGAGRKGAGGLACGAGARRSDVLAGGRGPRVGLDLPVLVEAPGPSRRDAKSGAGSRQDASERGEGPREPVVEGQPRSP